MTNYRKLILLVAFSILVLQTFACLGVAAACVEPSPSISLTPSSGISVITVTGSGFPKNQGIHIFWNGVAVPGWLGDFSTSHDGTFCVIMTIQTQTPGTYNITVTVDGKSASAPFAVLDTRGPQGPQGDKGDKGDTGATGQNGTNGTVWYQGHGTPNSGIGVNNDYYLNVDNGDIYQKQSDSWILIGNIMGPQGPQGETGPQGPRGDKGDTGPQGPEGPQGAQGSAGENGTNGTMWYQGSGVPDSGTGVDNDFYLNTVGGNIYQKQSGSWVLVGNLMGPQGPLGEQGIQGLAGQNGTNGTNGVNGTIWHNGSGAPSVGIGANNDYYLNVDNGDVYQKQNGTWTRIGNIQGPKGKYVALDILPLIIAIVISSAAFLLSAVAFNRKKGYKQNFIETDKLLDKAKEYI